MCCVCELVCMYVAHIQFGFDRSITQHAAHKCEDMHIRAAVRCEGTEWCDTICSLLSPTGGTSYTAGTVPCLW